MGLAIVIKGMNFSQSGLGKVTKAEFNYLDSLTILGNDEYNGIDAIFFVSYAPATTSQVGVNWSIVSGNEFAEIDKFGKLTINKSAKLSKVTIKASSIHDDNIFTTKDVILTYYNPVAEMNIPSGDFTWEVGNLSDGQNVDNDPAWARTVGFTYLDDPCLNYCDVVLNSSVRYACFICFYDDDGNYLGGRWVRDTDLGVTINHEIPDGAKKFRVRICQYSIRKIDIDTIGNRLTFKFSVAHE